MMGSIHSRSATRGLWPVAEPPATSATVCATLRTMLFIQAATRRPRSGTPSASAMFVTSPAMTDTQVAVLMLHSGQDAATLLLCMMCCQCQCRPVSALEPWWQHMCAAVGQRTTSGDLQMTWHGNDCYQDAVTILLSSFS